ncbi:MAG: hypothetical protein LUG50_07365 [Planctomycetaceae bacterium]|nr:hypothetical protein [Planctomycetaceae bacterium]
MRRTLSIVSLSFVCFVFVALRSEAGDIPRYMAFRNETIRGMEDRMRVLVGFAEYSRQYPEGTPQYRQMEQKLSTTPPSQLISELDAPQLSEDIKMELQRVIGLQCDLSIILAVAGRSDLADKSNAELQRQIAVLSSSLSADTPIEDLLWTLISIMDQSNAEMALNAVLLVVP